MFKHYLTTALRHFRQHKLTTSINVVCLTIGLVCFLAIYAIVTYISHGDSHYPNADRIYMVNHGIDSSIKAPTAAWGVAKYLRVDAPELEAVARVTASVGILADEVPVRAGDNKAVMRVSYADAEFLRVFALPFLSGNSMHALDAPRSAVISARTADLLYGGVTKALGNVLHLQDSEDVIVRGVIGELKKPSHMSVSAGDSSATIRFDILLSMDVLETEAVADPLKQVVLADWMTPIFATYALLPTDGRFTADMLRARLNQFGPRYANSANRKHEFGAVLVSDYLLSSIGSLTKQEQTGVSATALFYFLGGIVLIAACLNYANLATAQASTRAKDIGMRRVVGARRSQIMLQFLIEAALVSTSALILAFATVLATILAFGIDGAGSILISVIATGKFWLMLAFLLTVVSLCAGVYPAFVLSQVRPTQAMRTAATRSGGQLTQRVLVATQFAAAAFLLVTVLSMNAQNGAFKELALSETADPFVLVSNNIRAASVDYEVLRTELLRQPHIQSVTASALSPWVMVAGSYSVGQSPQMEATRVRTVRNAIQQDFFSTFGVDILAGRVFDRKYADVETGPTSISNVVIDRALAEQNGWITPTEAIGKTLYDFVDPTKAPIPRRVIGVVGNRAMSIITVGPRSNMYVLAPDFATQPIVRISKSDRAAALTEIEQVWNKLAPNVALKMRFADQVVATAFQYFNVVWSVFSGVASLAFSMSILGLIGLSLHVIGRRKHEIGVRKTLGASVQGIVAMLLKDFSKPVIVANIVAWPLAYPIIKGYASIFASRVGISVAPFLWGFAITVVVAWIAVAAQATRAARMNPATVLRSE